MIYRNNHLYIFLVIWTILHGTLLASSLGLNSDCDNLTVDTTTYISTNGQVNINGTCSANHADNATTNIITYGSVLDLVSTCNIASTDDGNGVTTFTILFNFYNQDPATTFDAGLQTVQIQCTNTLNANISLTNNTQTSYRLTGVATASVSSSSTFESKITMTVPQTLYKVGDYVDVTISMTADPILSLKISPQLCRAASAASGGTTYDLVSSRCAIDPGTTINRTSDLQTDVRFEAFYFLQAGSQIYLECEILVCLSDSADANCDACNSNKRRRRRRSAEDDYHYIRSQVFTVYPREIEQNDANKTRPIRFLKGWSRTHPSKRGNERGMEGDRIHLLVVIILVSSLALLLILACIKRKYDLRKYEKLLLDQTSLVANEELCCPDNGKGLKDINQLI